MKPRPEHSSFRPLLVLLSLAASPWLLLISTANALFLDNQAELGYSLGFLLPFSLAFGACMTVGVFLVFLTRWISGLTPLLWAYFFAGPFFLIYTTLRELPESAYQEIILLGILGAVFLALILKLRKREPAKASLAWAWFSLALIIIDLLSFASRFEAETRRATASPPPNDRAVHLRVERPNIYHLLFDGYQSDVLPLTLTAETENDLRGFRFYPRNTTSSGRTRVSIPSVFIGRAWHTGLPRDRFISDAMSSEDSILHWLSKADYETTAYLHRRFSFPSSLFGKILHHDAYYREPIVRKRLLESDTFHVLWLYRFAPRLVSGRLLGDRLIQRIESKRLAPRAYVTGSYATFMNFLKNEELSGANNRYTFVHLLLPHDPFILDRNCEYQQSIDPLEQFRCANGLIGRFVRLLKRLGRFDDSLILIHGDHGMNFKLTDGLLSTVPFDKGGTDWNHPRSKALLLFKPAGQRADVELKTSEAETSLLDIAPTILRSIGVSSDQDFDGFSLAPGAQATVPRRRYYHYHTRDQTNEVYRFIVEGDRFEFDRILGPDDVSR